MSGPVDTSHLKPYENAARIYCKKVGVDPEVRVPRPHPEILGITVSVRMWEVVAEDLLDFSMKLVSLKEGAGMPKVVSDA